MVRVWRRGTALACAGVLIFLALALGGAVIPRAANADSLDPAALASQKALISSNLQTLAAGLKYQYEEDQLMQLGAYGAQSTATASMDIRRPGGPGEIQAHVLVLQFSNSEDATDYAVQGRDEWPMGNETTPIGNHQASISSLFNGSDTVIAKVGWVCGVQMNLVVLGWYSMPATDTSRNDVARSKLLALATTVHEAFVGAGICDKGKPANTTPPPDSTLQSLFGTFDVDVVTFIQQNADPESQAVAAVLASQRGAEIEARLNSVATDLGLANVPDARDAFKRLVYLASLLDNTGKPLFPTLFHRGVVVLIGRMAALSARDGTAVEPTNQLLTILAAVDMNRAKRSGQ